MKINMEEIQGLFHERNVINEDKLKELANSLKSNTKQIQPIIVRKVDGGFQVVVGTRRYLANKINDNKTIEAEVRELTDEQAINLVFAENEYRDDYTDWDLYTLLNKYVQAGLGNSQISTKIGKAKSWVSEKLAVGKDIQEVQEAVKRNEINARQARAIRSLPIDIQPKALDKSKGTTIPQTEKITKELKKTDKMSVELAKVREKNEHNKHKLEEVTKANRRLTEIDNEIKRLAEKDNKLIEKAPADLNGVIKKLDRVKIAYFDKLEKLEDKQGELNRLEKEIEGVKGIELERKHKAITGKYENAVKRAEKLRNELKEAIKDKDELKEDAKQIKREMKDYKINQATVDKYRVEVNTLQSEVNKSKEKHLDTIQHFDELEKLINDHKGILDERKDIFKDLDVIKKEKFSLQGLAKNEATFNANLQKGLKMEKELLAKKEAQVMETPNSSPDKQP